MDDLAKKKAEIELRVLAAQAERMEQEVELIKIQIAKEKAKMQNKDAE